MAPDPSSHDTGSPSEHHPERLLAWPRVRDLFGLSRTTVWRLQKAGEFPLPIRISSNRVAWRQSELLAWHRARTPRRLPEPRGITAAMMPVEPPKVRRNLDKPKPSAQVETEAAALPEAPTKARKTRKAAVPENQTAFDFGG